MFSKSILEVILKTKSLVTLKVLTALLAINAHADSATSAATIELQPQSCHKINEAVAALPPAGGTVKLAAGDFICDSPIIVSRDNVSIVGAGSTKTFIRASKGKAIPVFIIGTVFNSLQPDLKAGIPYPNYITRNVSLSGVSINGAYLPETPPGHLECWDPKTDTSQNCGKDVGYFIRNNSLTVRRTHHVRVSDIQANSSFSGGIVLEKLNLDIIIDGFSATMNAFDGFAGYETNSSLFKNFIVFENRYSGISVDCDFNGNIFEDGIATRNGDNGVFSADVSNNIYRRLKVIKNGNLGFYIDGMRTDGKPVPGTCDGNEIHDTIISGPKFGVQINFPCKGIVINNVTIEQPKLECLSLFPGLDISITGSTCSDANRPRDKDDKTPARIVKIDNKGARSINVPAPL